MKEQYYGQHLLNLYYKKNLAKLAEDEKAEKQKLEDEDELLQDVRTVEDHFNEALTELKERFIEVGKGEDFTSYIPEDYFSIDVEDYFDGFTEITKKYNDLRNKLNEKILLVKGHLLLASIGGEALDILHQHKIVDKKTGEVIIDGTSKKK